MGHEARTAAGHINHGIREFNADNRGEAREHFIQAVILEPDSERAWLWLAEVSDDSGERRYCLGRALDINPDSVARGAWNRMQDVEPVVPPGIADVHRPPMPPSFRTSARHSGLRRIRPRRRNRRAGGSRRWPLIALLAVLLLAMAGAILVQREDAGERRHIAVVAPLSGPDAESGEDVRDGAQVAVDDLNARYDGSDLELVVFDDRNDPDTAVEIAREIVDDNRILAVIGHSSSPTTLAAAPIYAEAGLPVVSGQATANDLDDIPEFFRVMTTDAAEGAMLASYSYSVLGFGEASAIVGPGIYEQEVGRAFTDSFAERGTVGDTWTLTEDDRDASIAAIVEAVGNVPDDTVILLALTRTDAHDVLLEIRRAGHDPHLLGVESMGSSKFAADFAAEPEELDTPGYFTDGLYATSPLIFDSAIGDSLAFARSFSDRTGRAAGWRGANAHDAVVLVDHAIRNSEGAGDVADQRQGVLEALRAIDSPERALRGVTGPLHFDASGNVPGALNMGVFKDGHLISAPVQYQLVSDADGHEVGGHPGSGAAFAIGDQILQPYRVAYVGVEMIELRDLDTSAQTYTADFFVYFRYTGDDTPTNVLFTNATDSGLSVGDPIAESTDESGLNYRLFRVRGTFTKPMQFKDYPWDQHDLSIQFQNSVLDQTELVYAADLAAIEMPQSARLASGFDRSQPFNRIPNWSTDYVQFAQYTVTSASDDYSTDRQVQYSEFRTLVHVERQTASFLFKNLLPLALLSIVTYVFLWFPAEQAGTRVGASITALLTSAVMLNSVSSQLPDIGYTVAIEWGFYIYLGVAAVLVILNVLVDRSFKAKRLRRVRVLDALIRTLFPMVVLGTALGYVIAYW